MSHAPLPLHAISRWTDGTLTFTRLVTALPPTRTVTRLVTVTVRGVPRTMSWATLPRATIGPTTPVPGVAQARAAPRTTAKAIALTTSRRSGVTRRDCKEPIIDFSFRTRGPVTRS